MTRFNLFGRFVAVLFLFTALTVVAAQDEQSDVMNTAVSNKDILDEIKRQETPSWERIIWGASAVITLAIFLLVGDIRRYLWRNIIKGNLLWLREINCPPQFFDLTIKGYKDSEGTKYRFCRCPPGTFRMGSPVTERGHQEDEQQHTVTISRVFWIGETPVTNELWTEIMSQVTIDGKDDKKISNNEDDDKKSSIILPPPKKGETEATQKQEIIDHREDPVTGKSWYECQIFVKKLNQKLEEDQDREKRFNQKFKDEIQRTEENARNIVSSLDYSFETWWVKYDDWKYRCWLFVLPILLGLVVFIFLRCFQFNAWWACVLGLLSFIILIITTKSAFRWNLSWLAHCFLWGSAYVLRKITLLGQFFPKPKEEFPSGFKFALPSEAQWEYACRTRWNALFPPTAYCYGSKIDPDEKDNSDCDTKGRNCVNCKEVDCLKKYAWYAENRRHDGNVHEVSKHDPKKSEKEGGECKLPNRWGVYDMHGNVWEWVNDWYGAYPDDNVNNAIIDPTGPVTSEETKERVWRGGSYQRTAYGSRSARRQMREPIWEHPRLGFRLVLVHEDNPSNPKVVRLSTPPIRVYCEDGGQQIVFNFRKCPAGAFRMGSVDWHEHKGKDENGDEYLDRQDEYRHIVGFSQDFYIGETTVTIAQWNAVLHAVKEKEKGELKGLEERHEKNDLPVTYVSWFQCMRFVNAANNVRENILPDAYKDYKFALPTEAQWEYACRADKDKCDFSYGKERKDEKGEEIFASKLEGYAVYKYPQDTTKSTADIIPRPTSPAEIGLKKSRKGNNWLIYDMHGNVREWCADRYGAYAPEYGKETGTPKMRKDPTGSRDGEYRVLRGGGYDSDDEHCRSASRDNQLPELSKDDIGFRVVLVHKNSPFWIAFEKLHVKNLDKEEKLADERKKANMRQSE